MEKRMDSIDLTPKQHSEVKALLKRHLPNVEVWAYGSRVTFKTRHNSDLDLVAFVDKERRSAPHRLREAFEESYLPFSVDVLVWDDIPDRFKPNIRRAYYVLQERPLRQNQNSKKQMKLIDFAELNPKVEIRKGEPYPFLEMKDINPQARYISTTKTKAYKGSGAKFMPGDTLFARITPCLENGKISQYRGAPNAPAWGSTEFIVLRGKQGVSDTNFVYYLSQFSEFRDFAIKQMEGTSGRQRVAHSAIAKFSYEFPSLVKQKAIAHVLGLLDDKIEHNHKVSETLEETAKAIFRSWFVDFAPVRAKMEGRPTGLSPDISALFPEKLTQSKIGEIPQGWEVKALDQIGNFRNGLALQNYPAIEGQEKLPVIKIAQLRKGNTVGDNIYASGVANDFIIDDEDFIFSWSGTLMAKYWVGGKGALNQHLFKVEGRDCPLWYVSEWVKQYMPKFQFIAADMATTMGHIKREHLKKALCVVPPKKNLNLLGETILNLIKRQILALQESKGVSELRDILLPKLISGELQIADAKKLIKEAT